MFTSRCRTLLFAGLVGCTGCGLEPSEYRFGVQLTGLEFELFSDDVGIHPNQEVLADPNNPFRLTGVGGDAKFDILEAGGNVGTFYAWATLLATGANGEAQFYAAGALEAISNSGEVDRQTARRLQAMAIRGYQAILDFFPDSRIFAANGIESFRLATPAYLGIVRLGGIPKGQWVLVQTADGGQEAVWASGGIVTPVEEVDDTDDEVIQDVEGGGGS